MEFGVDSFVATDLPPAQWGTVGDGGRIANLLAEARTADGVGLDVFAIGEHHRPEFLASSPAVLLAAMASITRHVRLASAVTVLSTDDPLRVFQQFATLDLISGGRAEIIVGRGSFVESYPLFGHDLRNYDILFQEKLDLLLRARERATVAWSGRHRPPLTGQGVYPRPLQASLPVKVAVGGSPQSFVRAGTLGLPLVVGIIGGNVAAFGPLIELYREAGRTAGHPADRLSVAIHCLGFLAESYEEAGDLLYPAYAEGFARIGRERGWAPTNRAQFEAARAEGGALLCGDPKTVAEKILAINRVLGGIDRVTLALNGGRMLGHDATVHAISLLGREVAPLVRTTLRPVGNHA